MGMSALRCMYAHRLTPTASGGTPPPREKDRIYYGRHRITNGPPGVHAANTKGGIFPCGANLIRLWVSHASLRLWSGHPSVIPSAHGSVSRHVRRVILRPATCEGLLILIEAWTSDQTNMYRSGDRNAGQHRSYRIGDASLYNHRQRRLRGCWRLKTQQSPQSVKLAVRQAARYTA